MTIRKIFAPHKFELTWKWPCICSCDMTLLYLRVQLAPLKQEENPMWITPMPGDGQELYVHYDLSGMQNIIDNTIEHK